jgi:hypothetical protein
MFGGLFRSFNPVIPDLQPSQSQGRGRTVGGFSAYGRTASYRRNSPGVSLCPAMGCGFSLQMLAERK